MKTGRDRRSGADSGMTLIELVIAMALFALVAVMGLQALTGTIRTTDRLATLDTDNADLSLALTLLRHDLAAAVPVLFHPPGAGPESSLAVSGDGRGFALSIGGQPELAGPGGVGLQRVIWRLDPGRQTLGRQVWLALDPLDSTGAAPEAVLLTDVSGLTLRTYTPVGGWVDGIGATGLTGIATMLPEAVEIAIDTGRHGRIVLTETLR